MRNNKTTAREPLRVSETVDVLSQQIQVLIKRDGSGQFESVQPSETTETKKVIKKRVSKKKK